MNSIRKPMDEMTKQLLKAVSDYDDTLGYTDAYSIRENGV